MCLIKSRIHLWWKLSKVKIERSYLDIIKAIYEKPTVNIILDGQKLKVFPLRSRTRQRCPFSLVFIQHSTRGHSHSDQTRRRNRNHTNWNRKVKLLLFADDMILYMENPIGSNNNNNKIVGPNKWIQQSSGIQNQHEEIYGIFILQ